jgi:ribosomal protein S12 methylthiotransferase
MASQCCPNLIRQLVRLDGLKWLRLLYCYPTAVSERLIEAMAESEKVARYIDIPLQHSHPEILRAMQRGGDAESYARLIERLRTAMPDIAIRTTFIVGFPGETDKHFEHLLDFVKAMEFDRVGVFVFSPEPGTPAHELPNRVPTEIAEERRHLILAAQQGNLTAKESNLRRESFGSRVGALGQANLGFTKRGLNMKRLRLTG